MKWFSKQLSFNRVTNIGIGGIILAILIYAAFGADPETTIYSNETRLAGDILIGEQERIVIEHGSRLVIDGNFTVEGELRCNNGPLLVEVAGNLVIDGKVLCRRDSITDYHGMGISFLVSGSVSVSPQAIIATNGNIEFYDQRSNSILSPSVYGQTFAAVAEDRGSGLRVGPFVPITLDPEQKTDGLSTEAVLLSNGSSHHNLASIVFAQENRVPDNENTIQLSGNWILGNPAQIIAEDLFLVRYTQGKHLAQAPIPLVSVNFVGDRLVSFENFALYAQGAPSVEPVRSDSCQAVGVAGISGSRVLVQAGSIESKSAEWYLANGGDGGDVEVRSECVEVNTLAGSGAESGNLKLLANDALTITGRLLVDPGQAGSGGSAKAEAFSAAPACPGVVGGDARAQGGDGYDNQRGLKIVGGVTGVEHIVIGDLQAGHGGHAQAVAGHGSDGNACGCDAGDGGNAYASGGVGGTATSRNFESFGGNGGSARSMAGHGGNGGSCADNSQGGNGGDGGVAESVPGLAGSGKTSPGQIGDEENIFGVAGDGGDGCPAGVGGQGDPGQTADAAGVDGLDRCLGV